MIRLWPGFVLVALMYTALLTPPMVAPGSFVGFLFMVFTPMIAGLLFLFWWLFSRRAPAGERWALLAVVALGGVGMVLLAHPTMAMGLVLYAIPAVSLAWILSLAFTMNRPTPRRILVPLAILGTMGYFTLLRLDGVNGSTQSQISYRWSKTPEEVFLESRSKSATANSGTASITITPQPGDWPSFRGPNRDNRVTGQRIRTDWEKRPPKQIWKQRIGPGWSAFTVVGDYAFTQEQRGEYEVVSCYEATSGKEVWIHEEKTRFEEALAGAGPRATPTFANGKLFTVGASGLVQAFDAGTGRLLWTRDLVQEFQATTPTWGFSSSPLVVGQAVAVYSGTVDKGVVTLDTETGKTIWNSGRGGHGYASLHAANIVGQAVWLNTTSAGLEALDPETGKTVWFHDWNCGEIVRCIQPGIIDENNVVVGTGLGIGTRLISITKTGSDPSTVAKYTTTKFKPYYNDFVIHQGHAFGFDGPIFICIDLKTGEAKWKGGRYGNGQVLLLPDQELLLVISETGELILLEANPKERKVISQFRAITGKTWNHPTLVRGKLFVRNAEEAACFDVSE